MLVGVGESHLGPYIQVIGRMKNLADLYIEVVVFALVGSQALDNSFGITGVMLFFMEEVVRIS